MITSKMEDDRLKKETGTNIFYMLGVLLLAKIVYSIFKSDDKNNEQLQSVANIEEDKTDTKPSIKKPIELGKNTFLHSADNFGKMESGRVL